MSTKIDFSDNTKRLIRPSLGLAQTLSSSDNLALNAQKVQTDYAMVQALVAIVPAELMPFMHQPFHAALDSAYVETKTPARIFLDPDNVFGFRTPSLKSFARRFSEQLSVLRKTDDPSEIEADSLRDVRLGKAIVQRKPQQVEFIGKLIMAEQRWITALLIDSYSAG